MYIVPKVLSLANADEYEGMLEAREIVEGK